MNQLPPLCRRGLRFRIRDTGRFTDRSQRLRCDIGMGKIHTSSFHSVDSVIRKKSQPPELYGEAGSSRAGGSVAAEQTGVGPVRLNRRKNLPGGHLAEFGVPAQEPFDLKPVLLQFNAAGAVDQLTAGGNPVGGGI